MADILKTLAQRSGVELTSKPQTEEERLEAARKKCEMLCEGENNKEGHLHEYDGYSCALCKNKGYSLKPQMYLNDYQEVQVTCRCMKTRKTIRALNRSGLADVVHDYTFDKYIITDGWQQTVFDKAQAYLNDAENHWFFFGGTTGSGKTHICTAIAVSLLKCDLEVKYMLWRDEASRLKALVNDERYEGIVREYKTVDVLYIDDLFKTGRSEGQKIQRPTQADINLAFEILNVRASQKKITIISSESTLTDLIDIDEALAGRIKQKCGEYYINIAPDRSKNYRLR